MILTSKTPKKSKKIQICIEENDSSKHANMREKSLVKYISYVKNICKTEPTNKNKVTVINRVMMLVIIYKCAIVD